MKLLVTTFTLSLAAAATSMAQYYYVQPNCYQEQVYQQQAAAYYQEQQYEREQQAAAYYQEQQYEQEQRAAAYYQEQEYQRERLAAAQRQEYIREQQQAAADCQQQEDTPVQQPVLSYRRQQATTQSVDAAIDSACDRVQSVQEEVERCKGYGEEAAAAYADPVAYAGVKYGEAVERNIQVADRESGPVNKAVKIVFGISDLDIKNHGILGGQNSEARKAVNGVKDVGSFLHRIL